MRGGTRAEQQWRNNSRSWGTKSSIAPNQIPSGLKSPPPSPKTLPDLGLEAVRAPGHAVTPDFGFPDGSWGTRRLLQAFGPSGIRLSRLISGHRKKASCLRKKTSKIAILPSLKMVRDAPSVVNQGRAASKSRPGIVFGPRGGDFRPKGVLKWSGARSSTPKADEKGPTPKQESS